MPAGMTSFPTGSPYNYGYEIVADYDDRSWWFVAYSGDQSTHYQGGAQTAYPSLSINVVGNDTGSLDKQTVDLAPNVPGVQREILASVGGDYYFRYSYNPSTDRVTITPVDPATDSTLAGFDWDAYDEYVNQYYDDHDEDPDSAAQAAYFTNHGIPMVAASKSKTAGDVDEATMVAWDAYNESIPYVIQSTDGTKTVTANIIIPIVTISYLV